MDSRATASSICEILSGGLELPHVCYSVLAVYLLACIAN